MKQRLFFVRLGSVAGLLTVALAIPVVFLGSDMNPLAAGAISAFQCFGLVIWLVGVRAFQRQHLGRLGSAGVITTVVGLIGILCLQLIQVAAQSAPTGMASRFLESPILPPLLSLTVFLVVWGSLALGTASLQVGIFPRGVVALWMVGLVMLLLVSWIPVTLLAATGVMWSSLIMLRRAPVQQDDPSRDRPLAQAVAIEDSTSNQRLLPLDALRGMIMVLMAIDHASYFVRRWHPFETWDQPLPDYPSLAAMLTRLATHPCAPVSTS